MQGLYYACMFIIIAWINILKNVIQYDSFYLQLANLVSVKDSIKHRERRKSIVVMDSRALLLIAILIVSACML